MLASSPEKPLVKFLHSHLQQLIPLFSDAALIQSSLVDDLRDSMQEALYSSTTDACFLPFLLLSCQAIPGLNLTSLSRSLASDYSLKPIFMSQPPSNFDGALVPIVDADVIGSSYVFYFEESLVPNDIYYLLAHAYGHLALGHLRKGDVYSHYDVLSELRSPNGPSRRWDRAVQERQYLWFSPLPPSSTTAIPEIVDPDWSILGFSEAFDRLKQNDVDDRGQAIQAFASRHGTAFLQVDFEIGRDAQLFPHQKRGAAELVVRLQKLGVALLADSVGLGKTRTVATVIKLLRQNNLIQQAAVLTPNKLEHNWLAELNQLDLIVGVPGDSHADVVIINKDKFKRMDASTARREVRGCKLLIVEEAHQDMRKVDNKFHRNMREVAFDRYGLLVTATPWNNRRGDIFAMLQPFASNTLGAERPTQVFSCFTKGLDVGQQEFEQDTEVFQQIYNRTTLQRTRRQLRESGDANVFYATRRPYLINVVYTEEQRKAFATLLDKIEELQLPHFDPIRYLISVDQRENRLSGIYRFVLLKRAESSMYSFALSLTSLANKAQEMYQQLKRVDDTETAIASWLRNRYKIEEDAEVSFDRENTPEVLVPPKGRLARNQQLIDQAERQGHLRRLRLTLLDNCLHDRQIIQAIQQEFRSLLTKDPKLEAVLQQIHASIRSGQKVLCISQFTDTAYAVYLALLHEPLLREKGIGLVMGSAKDGNEPIQINGLPAKRDEVIKRFAPNSWVTVEKKKTKQVNPNDRAPTTIDILVGSDTLSVGQNLQDAHVLLNLDLCWNPMLHEQRIGRIDRPRHSDDSAPLDIFYFLNLDLIESELRLRETIERRLAATYRDTAFDDEVLPGYFDMIEQFSNLRKKQAVDKNYVAEADAILESIAERSATPSEIVLLNSEREREALFRLQEAVKSLINDSEDLISDRQLVSIGRVPYDDWQGSPHSHVPQAALVAEVSFHPIDRLKKSIGQSNYRYFYIALHEPSEANPGKFKITTDSEIVSVVDALLSEPSSISLKRGHIDFLLKILVSLEEQVKLERDNQIALLKRARRYHNASSSSSEGEEFGDIASGPELMYSVEARLINIRFLI